MKLTKHKREWVQRKVEHYCSLLKCPIPKIFLTMTEYNKWKLEERAKTGYTRVGRVRCLGVCHNEDGFIVILVKRSPCLARLDETIRHELLHGAKPSYNHRSQAFWNRMQRLKNGKINESGRFC